jgi:hypothetical protein
MTKQSLYILAFKDEAMIKVGLAGDPWLRIASLGSARFDLSASYLIRCRDQSGVRVAGRDPVVELTERIPPLAERALALWRNFVETHTAQS